MAKKDLEKQRQKDLVKRMWADKGPRMLEKMYTFIDQNFEDEDKDVRRDAHKLFMKLFDSQVPKTLITEQKGNEGYLNKRVEQALNMMLKEAPKMIEVEEAEIVPIDDDEALRVRNETRK